MPDALLVLEVALALVPPPRSAPCAAAGPAGGSSLCSAAESAVRNAGTAAPGHPVRLLALATLRCCKRQVCCANLSGWACTAMPMHARHC